MIDVRIPTRSLPLTVIQRDICIHGRINNAGKRLLKKHGVYPGLWPFMFERAIKIYRSTAAPNANTEEAILSSRCSMDTHSWRDEFYPAILELSNGSSSDFVNLLSHMKPKARNRNQQIFWNGKEHICRVVVQAMKYECHRDFGIVGQLTQDGRIKWTNWFFLDDACLLCN